MADGAPRAVRNGPLHAEHEALGAKLGDFGGWLMPLEYAGGGVIAEHSAVRERVGVFDVSHMGTLHVSGAGTMEVLNRTLTNDLRKLSSGQAQYTMLCAPDGGVVDDLLVYLRSVDDVLLVPNASNTAAVFAALTEACVDTGVAVADLSSTSAILAVQGPLSGAVLDELGLPWDFPYMNFVDIDVDGMTVARSGYTGELGYELIVRAAAAPGWWLRILAALTAVGGLPCGLGARDTLRTEMGYPLHGHELSRQISPVQAGMSWVVGWGKPDFVGRAALAAQRGAEGQRVLGGLLCVERAIPRVGMAVKVGNVECGVVTSGTFSPTLKQGIALAMLDRSVSVGDQVVLDVRGRSRLAEVVRSPFIRASPK